MPFALGANQLVDESYQVSNSIRFDDSSTPKLTRTNASGGDRQKFTISFWTKRTTVGATHIFFDVGTSTSTDSGSFTCSINSSDKLFIGGGATSYRQTNRLFRDVSAWYHIVVAVDSTDSTADDRIKIYVNGVQETSFTTNNAITLNQNTPVNESGKVHQICNRQKSSSLPYDGYMCEFNIIDGQQLLPTSFGEFDDNGVWIPIEYSGSYGTNGAFLEFKQSGTSADSSGMGADTSGNDNHFTPTNLVASTDITTDTCTNNFATLNPLRIERNTAATYSEGNTKVSINSSFGRVFMATIPVSSGKWYFECKHFTSGDTDAFIGVVPPDRDSTSSSGQDLGSRTGEVGWRDNGGIRQGSSVPNDTESSWTDGDILGIALDMDNKRVYFHKNGTYQNSADPSGTNGYVLNLDEYVFTLNSYANDGYFANFGNPAFSISSGNSDAEGFGNFEYAVPSGYFALCTKNLAEYG